MRDDLLVMLSGLHVFGQQVQSPETLAAAHTLENISGLLICPAYPDILAPHQLPGDGHLVPQHVPLWPGGRGEAGR